VAEVIGNVDKYNGKESSIDHDKQMRTFGFHRAAQRTADNLPDESKKLLAAYCDGVNAWFHDHHDNLPPDFARMGLQPEPWTPADCLASWWHLGQFFATDGTRDLIAGRNPGRMPQPPPGLSRMKPDEAPAVVKRSDVSGDWVQRVQRFAADHALQGDDAPIAGPKFSHAWVVGAKRTTTGSSVLVSDPQTPVRNPSLFYEFHMKGATFNARGIGVPGSPIILIGFTDRVAWGMTALGADQADLFLLETDPSHPNQYKFDDNWRPMTVREETIQVKGSAPIKYTVRETHLGPVATAFCFAQPGDGEVALKRVPMCEPHRDTIQGALAMMRAADARQFDRALGDWRFPTANVVFGDRDGNIGYRALGAIPIRSTHDKSQGRGAQPARSSHDDWRQMLPDDLKPGVINPAAGFLYSANHRPIEAWYPIPLGAMTGGGGDTLRSWRLRERLTAIEKFTPEQVLQIHGDMVNPARRDIVKLALHLRDAQKQLLSDDAFAALLLLEPWYRAGAPSSLDVDGSALALELSTFFRFISTDLASIYGGGESGLAYFLKTADERIQRDPHAALTELEAEFIDNSLAAAWRSCQQKYGGAPKHWQEKARAAVTRQRLGYLESLDGFPAIDSTQAVAMPALTDIDGGTIACQSSQSYTQWVPMNDPDTALTILPIGESERAGQPSRTSTLSMWGERKLHPAPLSKAKVESLGGSRMSLNFPQQR
jgi:penicillin amidase